MAEFEKDITAGAGIEAEVEVTVEVSVDAAAGIKAEVEGELVLAGQVLWEKTLAENAGDPIKTAAVLTARKSLLKLRKVSAQKKILQIQKLFLQDRVGEIKNLDEAGHIAQIWCADYTDDLTGDVGIIEVPGEQTARNIQPGYDGNAVYNAERDGQILPAIVSTPAAAFWNLAMMPGWQKWQPTYRYGTITVIDYEADTCSLNLEAATSSQQSINVNQGTALSGVPIQYMQCNAAAFAVDDVVLIKFTGQDFAAPEVIGFKDHPKPCGARWVMFKVYATGYDAHYVVWDALMDQFADLSAWSGPTLSGDYPCSEADLAAWVAATTEVDDAPCYTWTAAGESVRSNDVSANTGCGVLTNSNIEDITFGWIDCPDWDEEVDGDASWDFIGLFDRFYPAYRGASGVQGDSYNLSVADALGGAGETACSRLELTQDLDYEEFVPCPGAEPWLPTRVRTDDFQYRRYCPLGWLDTYTWLNEEDGGCSIYSGGLKFPYVQTQWETLDSYHVGKSPENQNVKKMARFSGTIMCQFYVFQASGQYRERENPVNCQEAQFGAWSYLGSPARLTDAKIAVDYSGDITAMNPKDQVGISVLESKVEAAMNSAADEVGLGDKRCIDNFKMTMRI